MANKKIDLKIVEIELVKRKEPIAAFENLHNAIENFNKVFAEQTTIVRLLVKLNSKLEQLLNK